MPLTDDAAIRDLLTAARTVAVVGLSDSPDRPSWGVAKALVAHGYRMLPVNPKITGEHVHGEFVWRELAQIGEPIDIVDVFRRADEVDAVVEDAIRAGAKAVWLQQGIVNEAAAARAEAAGLAFVQDRCMKVELARLGVPAIGEKGA